MSVAHVIAAALGGAHRSGAWWSCRCPAHDDRTPSLSLRDGARGLIVNCWAGCDARDVLAALRRHGLFTGTDDRRSERVTVRSDDRDNAVRRVALARQIWDAAQDARETPVEQYLRARRITIPVPRMLRWAPSLRRPDGTCGPAMVARIDNIDGALIGVHRTWLVRGADGIWRRRDRAMLGRAAGGAVRLAPAAATLMVAEGIETALAGSQATGMPAWAALSTSGMVALVLPALARTVIILADHDASGAGERAARAPASLWETEARHASIWMSPCVGEDANDRLLAALTAEARDAA
jgi:putative DNA primase/helicase